MMTDGLMMQCWVVLRKVICQIIFGWCPVEEELVLRFAVAKPVVPHVDGFGSFLFDGFMDETQGGGVIEADMGGRLRETQFGKCNADRYGVLAVGESCCNFTISRGGGYMFQDVGGVDPTEDWLGTTSHG